MNNLRRPGTKRGKIAAPVPSPAGIPTAVEYYRFTESKKMSRKGLSAIVALLALVSAQSPLRAYTLQYRDSSGVVARRWVARPIIVAFSSSLSSPPSNIKVGSDVIGAARRALQRWARVADIQFLETRTTVQTVSSANAGDRVNLITVSADNAGLFGSSENPGRTRVFSDSGGAIVEADIALNPNQLFSSDGTTGTYDLESTFAHEVGHLLGLEHSAVIGSTMQPRQAQNGMYGLPAFTERTLSEDDIAGARALYGSQAGTGSIAGRLVATSVGGSSKPVFGGHVFAEDAVTGRLVAGSITLATGDYRIDALDPGRYRLIGQSLDGPVGAADIAAAGGSYANLLDTIPPFRSIIRGAAPSQSIAVTSETTTSIGFFVSSSPAPLVKPRLIGMNGELSTAALPLEGGGTYTIYIAGEGVNRIPPNGISTSSPFLTIDESSVAEAQFDTPYPVISFQVTVDPYASPGEYSIRLQSIDGEFVYLAGAITIEP
jgi:Matrixin